ncbi:hypothetical protein TGAMA5MH_03339 [Trichoderma gamsii]|uniref:Uncharacterized protein n=1 Tax=Trichoderma gamsii TaxID=398673 RepID=A0A2K0THC3_9HYPO|nr:hypothetical protein TGAMA5MH_03339 [Trichoderma gamsii]
MASNARNPNHGVVFSSLRPLRDRLIRAGYVLVSEEQESGSEYSGSTCCCCSSCASSCSCDEYTDDDDSEEEDGESDDEEIVFEQAEVVEEEEGYWSDCSACWARRRDRERRGRAVRRFGNRVTNVARAVEGRDSIQVYHHNHPYQREQHRGRNETPQANRRNANHVTFRSTNSIINGSIDNNGQSTAAETPSFRGLVDRIVSTTRQLRQGQGEQPVRHLRSWARVLEDLQRGANAAAASDTTADSTVAARAGRQNPAPRTAVGRAANVAGDDGNGAREAQAQTQNQARPRRATSYFMSGGRSASDNRRRRR